MVIPAGIAQLISRGILDDPWSDGRLRVQLTPATLTTAEAGALATTACTTLMALDHLVPQVAARADLQAAIGLDASLSHIAALDAPQWLGLARVDVFATEDDAEPQACEVNCDTPTGLAETTELAAVIGCQPGLVDPAARLAERWIAMVRGAAPQRDRQPVVGLIDATDQTEDIGHIRLLCRWLAAAAIPVVRGSPANLTALPGERIGLFGQACDVLVRHYKTDWWAARRPLWRSAAPPPDAAPLAGPLALIARAMAAGTVGVVNPWGAAIGQNKRTLALPWEAPELLPYTLRQELRARVPETRWLESLSRDHLLRERGEWVLKSDYGCEGEEVLLGSETPADMWATALADAAPGRWIVQHAFRPRRDAAGQIRNHGVYTIGGLPSGIYTRCSPGATTATAIALPTLVEIGDSRA